MVATAEYVTILGQDLPVGTMCSLCEVNVPSNTSDDPPLLWCRNCTWIIAAYGVVPVYHALSEAPARRARLLEILEQRYGR